MSASCQDHPTDPPRTMRLGIGSYTYVWSVGVPGTPAPERPMTPWNLLDLAAELGVRVVQFADNLPLIELPERELDALVRQAWALNIDLEAGMRGFQADRLRAWLELASRIGSPILRVVPDSADHRPTPDEIVATLHEVLPGFERSHVVLAIENHDRFPAARLLDILHRAESRCLGICFDTANSIGCLESAERVLDVLGPHVVNVHVKDYRIDRPVHHKGFVVEGRPAGQGELDIPRLIDRLRSLDRNPNVIVELWPPPQATLEQSIEMEHRWARESVAYLRQFVRD